MKGENVIVPTELFNLIAISETRNILPSTLLLGNTIPILNAEFELLKTYELAKQRLEWQREKGIK